MTSNQNVQAQTAEHGVSQAGDYNQIAASYERVPGQPAITVVTALYNCQAYIGETIASLKRQTFEDFEAIIVDSHSSDGSVAAAREAMGDDPRFSLIELHEDSGPWCRNLAFDRARGEYLVIVDSDDYLVDDALAKLIVRARTQNLDDLYFSAESFYETEEDFPQLVEDFSHRPSFEGVATGRDLFVFFEQRDAWFVQGALRMVRRQLVEDNHIRMPEGIIHEDILFTFYTAMASQRSSFLNEPIYRRRIRPGSIMNTPKRAVANVRGHFVSSCGVREWLAQHASELSDEFMACIGKRLAQWAEWSARDWDDDIDEASRQEFLAELTEEQKLNFFVDLLGVGRAVVAKRTEYESSLSYRAGHALLAPARALGGRLRGGTR